jgi:hypothetical protein
MKVLMMIAADLANVDNQTKKLNIIGMFRSIQAGHFPITLNRMCLVIKIGGDITDSHSPHKLEVSLTDDDGKEMLKIEGTFEMPKSPPGIDPEYNALFEFNQLVFPKPGDYCFYLEVDDAEVEASTVIQVVKLDTT